MGALGLGTGASSAVTDGGALARKATGAKEPFSGTTGGGVTGTRGTGSGAGCDSVGGGLGTVPSSACKGADTGGVYGRLR